MIFCVEDDSAIRELMIYTLNTTGFKATGFEESATFWEALKEQEPELILLDIMLPGEDGIAILKKLRSQTEYARIPVIMATAKGTEYDKVMGLDMGADDYLAKPFGMMEMISRIKAVLRRTGKEKDSKVLRIDSLELKIDEHTVLIDGKRIGLTLKEYELLNLFMGNPGRVFTREQLLTQIWSSDYIGETRTVDVHIGTLRTKLGKYGEYLETVRGVGYRMKGKGEHL